MNDRVPSTTSGTPARASRLGWWVAGASMAIVLVTYWPSFERPLGSDARFLSYQNEFVRNPGGVAQVWTADFFEGAITGGVPYLSGYYRPVTNTMFWAEYRVAGERDWVYHVSQTLLHALNAVLIFLLCRRIGRDPSAAAIAAILFVAHPVHAFAATEPAARADVLFPVFYLGALLAFDGALQKPDGRSAVWGVATAVLLYAATVLSKEMGITLPAVFVLLVLLHHFRDGRPWRRLLWTLPAWGVFVAYLGWRFGLLDLAAPSLGYGERHSALALALGALKGMVIHVSRIVVPLGADYPELNPQLVNFIDSIYTDPLALAGVVALVGTVTLALGWRRAPVLAFWSGFFLVTFSPLFRVDNIAGTLGRNVILTQERWIYLPAVAVFALIGMGAVAIWRTPPTRLRVPRPALATGAVIALLLLARAAAAHAGRHEDPFAQLRLLYALPVERLGRLERANKLLLYAQWVAVPTNDLDEAEVRARAAVALVPESPIAAAGLSTVLARRGKWTAVDSLLSPWFAPTADELRRLQETHFRVADDLNRSSPTIALLLARAKIQLGQPALGVDLLCEAVRRRAPDPLVADGLQEALALHGSPNCTEAENPGACVAAVALPAGESWTPPFSTASCSAWRDAIGNR